MSAIIDVLARTELFSTLKPNALRALCEGGRTINLPDNGHLFEVGEMANAYYLMTSGVMRLYRPGLDGEDKVFQVVAEGDLVAETAMFSEPCIYPLSAEAESASTLIRLPRPGLLGLVRVQPDFALRLLGEMSHRLYQAVNRLDQLTVTNAGQRVAMYLLELTEWRPEHWVVLPVSAKVLARQLNVTPETLSRLLTRFRQSGLISGRGRRWMILDPTELCRAANLPLPDAQCHCAGSQFFRCCNFSHRSCS
ncbi:Crp/Fnr family transcriptional regulator [Alcanivorax sp. 24]|uniref:Crp/Fnr family transcriptional regulator n=1 Tax=Alcanivorax sp. 24 TaxID=2545266 RepID=UPI001062376C|nr:Crp/Fnr family transcriptional regulator [Alcanivorax sp. 24]